MHNTETNKYPRRDKTRFGWGLIKGKRRSVLMDSLRLLCLYGVARVRKDCQERKERFDPLREGKE
jgi:hypothetical protein